MLPVPPTDGLFPLFQALWIDRLVCCMVRCSHRRYQLATTMQTNRLTDWVMDRHRHELDPQTHGHSVANTVSHQTFAKWKALLSDLQDMNLALWPAYSLSSLQRESFCDSPLLGVGKEWYAGTSCALHTPRLASSGHTPWHAIHSSTLHQAVSTLLIIGSFVSLEIFDMGIASKRKSCSRQNGKV